MILIFSLVILIFVNGEARVVEPCQEGVRENRKTSVRKCKNGKWIWIGCLADDGKFVTDGGLVRTETNLLQCQKGTDQSPKLVQIGCLKDGHLLAPSQVFTTDDSYYICTPINDSLGLRLAGCIGPNKEQVPLHEILKVESFVFQCKMQNGKPFMAPYACLENGTMKLVDNFNVDGLLMHVCLEAPRTTTGPETTGCVDHGVLIKPNQVFHSSGYIFKCQQRNGYLEPIGIGCLELLKNGNVIEHKISEKWLEEKDDVNNGKHLMECKSNDFGTVYKAPVQCYFTDYDMAFYLNPGCMKLLDKVLYECVKTTNQRGLRSVTIQNPTEENKNVAKWAGLKYCD